MANAQQTAMQKPVRQALTDNDSQSPHDVQSLLEVTQNVFDTNDEGL